MVDCDFFTQFNKLLVIQQNRVLLDYKNCDYTLEILFPNQTCKKVAKINSTNFLKKMPIKAVYGIIQMQINKYLIVVTKASVIGQIYHRKIFQVQKIQFVCLASKQYKQDKIYIKGLQQIFGNKYFYFSDDYDLTNSLQQFVNSNYSMKNKKINYMFNGDWVDDFLKIKAYQWITGFISGFISINFTHTGVNNACQIALISRRDKRRQGKRWVIRGCDLDGNTANTAQTQLIFLTQSAGKQYIFSYVQLRGSMPFVWTQFPDMKWSPKVAIHHNDKLNTDLTKKNYEDIKHSYQNCTLINLIDRKGSQKRLGQYFDKMHNSIGDSAMKLVWFDFHYQCRKMKYQNLAKLLDMCSSQLENYGYFHIELTKNTGQRVSRKNSQKGIFRTNCMDCLDRTNVVQSVIARQLLLSWLIKLGIHNKSRSMSAFQRLSDNLQEIFRAQWTKNADVISILYSGTPAMKTDFTATGRRTNKGAFKDLTSGIRRWFLGNFYDSRSQDFIDFSLGKIKPKKNPQQKIRHSFFNPLFALIALVLIVPFLINHQVNSYYYQGQLLNHNQVNQSRFLIKLLFSFIVITLVLKLAQLSNTVFVRRPIRNQNRM